MNAAGAHRGTIFLEDASVLEHRAFAGAQHILRLAAPRCAAAAAPGSFVHLTCGPDLPMRRPLSIMRADREAGWIEVLYKVVGRGLAELALRRPGESLSCLGPIGRCFTPDSARPRLLLVGGGVGIPPMVFLAERVAAERGYHPLALMGSELPFPFELATSRLPAHGLPHGATAAMPLLESLGVPDVVKEFGRMRSGLVLVTGPTGSGKSTTLAALLDYINSNYKNSRAARSSMGR